MKKGILYRLLFLTILFSTAALWSAEKSDKLNIGTLSPKQWQAFRALRLQAIKETAPMIGVTEKDELERTDYEYEKLLKKAQEGQDAWMLFAKKKGKLVAMAGAMRRKPHLSTARHVADLFSVYTIPEERKKGIATQLIQTLLLQVKESGIKKVHLKVTETKQARHVVALYRNIGFEQCGNYSDDVIVGDGVYDSIIMEKNLQ